MNTPEYKGGRPARGSTKRVQGPTRRSTRIEDAEQAPESSTDTLSQSLNPSKSRTARNFKTPKSRKRKTTTTAEGGTNTDQRESSPLICGHDSAKPSSCSIQPKASISNDLVIPQRPVSSGMDLNILGGEPMSPDYSSPYKNDQDTEESSTKVQTQSLKPKVSLNQAQAPHALSSRLWTTENMTAAMRLGVSVIDYVTTKMLAPQMTNEERRAVVNASEDVSIASVQQTQDPAYPPVPSMKVLPSTQLPQPSLFTVASNNPGASTLGLSDSANTKMRGAMGGNSNTQNHRRDVRWQAGDEERNASRPESRGQFVAPPKTGDGPQRNFAFPASRALNRGTFGMYQLELNVIPPGGLASRPRSRDPTVGAVTMSGLLYLSSDRTRPHEKTFDAKIHGTMLVPQ